MKEEKHKKMVGHLIYNTETRIVDEWTRKNWRYKSKPPKYVFRFPWTKFNVFHFDHILNWKQSKKEFIENRNLFNDRYLDFRNYMQSNYNVELWECKRIWDLYTKSMIVVYGLNHLNK